MDLYFLKSKHELRMFIRVLEKIDELLDEIDESEEFEKKGLDLIIEILTLLKEANLNNKKK